MVASDYNGLKRWMVTLLVTVFLGFLSNAGISIWWAASLTERVDHNGERITENRDRIQYHERLPAH